jgi:hypothetical protein
VNVCPFASDQVYVDQDATGLNDGTSWDNAFTDLQDALDLVENDPFVRRIWIAEGTYYPTTTTDRSATFLLTDSVEIYGGFLGNESTLESRTSDASLVQLSGDIGNVNDSTDNVYHVIRGDALCSACLVDGATIRDGHAVGGIGAENQGGGLYNDGTLTLNNCVIERNTSAMDGAAICNTGMQAELLLRDCILHLNHAVTGSEIFSLNQAVMRIEGDQIVE